MEACPPGIVHYVGFGQYEGGHDAVQLDGSPDEQFEYLRDVDFARCFGEVAPRLVVLQPYKVSDTEVPVDFTTLAPALLDIGVQAVVAFPLPVDLDVSYVFFKAFYTQIMAGVSLRAAVQAGRLELENWSRPWAFPAVMASYPGDIYLASQQSVSGGPGVKP